MIILFLFFFGLVESCTSNRTNFLSCFDLFDLDHDNIVTHLEISNVLNIHNLNSTIINGPYLISQCDMNGDGVFTVAGDWNNANSCLLYPYLTPAWQITCHYCKLIGWTNPEQTKK